MNRTFRCVDGGVRVELRPNERALLVHLLSEVCELLDDGRGGESDTGDPFEQLVGILPPVDVDADAKQAPEALQDPALARLLPTGNRQDAQAAAEFRRLTEHGLRVRKRSSLDRAGQALNRRPPVVLADDEARSLLTGLTDIRLVLAERLGVRTEEDTERLSEALRSLDDPSDPRLALAALFETLAWWQELLVTALDSPE
ncbi:MAG: hypothetical protein QG608_3655 [Actinomycetota bacterium]|nr:hypothetical protein [Actinomycetota bacterium]